MTYFLFPRLIDAVRVKKIEAKTGIVSKLLIVLEFEANLLPLGFSSLSLFILFNVAHYFVV